jgi:hypothetical protein
VILGLMYIPFGKLFHIFQRPGNLGVAYCRRAIGLDSLGWLPKLALAVALVAWAACAYGLAHGGVRALRRRR